MGHALSDTASLIGYGAVVVGYAILMWRCQRHHAEERPAYSVLVIGYMLMLLAEVLKKLP